MGTLVPGSLNISTADKETGIIDTPKELDAGALFVLKSKGRHSISLNFVKLQKKYDRKIIFIRMRIVFFSKSGCNLAAGSWLHCGYHLTTSIVGPVIFSLPFTLALLGWVPGVLTVTLAALVTFYSYNLLSVVLEHHAQLGKRQLRFRDMARDILGPGWSKFLVAPLQFAICYGAVISCTLLGGQSIKFIYLLYQPKGTMQLYQFIVIFSAVPLILAQMPSFHSLRHINLVSLVLCLLYSACVVAGSIYIGNSKNAPARDYSMNGSQVNHIFGAFNGISIIATTYASGIIPEIQATIAPPVKGKMFKGLCICYTVIVITYFSVAISGYWTFGNQSLPTILTNFMGDGKPLLPTWFLLMTNIFTLMQLAAITVIYLQPTNEVFEKWFANPKMDQFSIRNVIPRLIFRSLSVISATFIAAMLPFFGDIMALFGAFGCIPLDFILPMVFYNVTFKPSKQSIIFWGNTLIAVVSSGLVAVGAVASVRQIVLDAKMYNLFANM
ncbi:GABA transporter 1-like isoform X1 [Pistacia vera]|uniref:GABA transporter 1-like isoform X1 n=1 Tax=Pistacia vera TaxID=55513 RepID=UPI001263DBCC|nr:GABA transporter 1-like isoform X1 [Pistacia vera]